MALFELKSRTRAERSIARDCTWDEPECLMLASRKPTPFFLDSFEPDAEAPSDSKIADFGEDLF